MTKQCYKCKERKVIELFYKHPDMPDGHVNKCIECSKIDNRPSSGNIRRTCKECKRKFNTNLTEVKRGGGLTCSRKCFFQRLRKIIGKEDMSPNWKGDKVGKEALHQWVVRQLGKPSKCEHCSTTKAKKYEWANKTQQYKRHLSDWIRLCTKCHAKYDYPTRHEKWKKSVMKLGWNVK